MRDDVSEEDGNRFEIMIACRTHVIMYTRVHVLFVSSLFSKDDVVVAKEILRYLHF